MRSACSMCKPALAKCYRRFRSNSARASFARPVFAQTSVLSNLSFQHGPPATPSSLYGLLGSPLDVALWRPHGLPSLGHVVAYPFSLSTEASATAAASAAPQTSTSAERSTSPSSSAPGHALHWRGHEENNVPSYEIELVRLVCRPGHRLCGGPGERKCDIDGARNDDGRSRGRDYDLC